MAEYDKPPELYAGLRLHQNEHTGGCSPRVTAALAALRPDQISVYPPYAAAIEACARHLGVEPSWLALTNGLDEGIMAAAIAYLRRADTDGAPEVVVPQPAFEIFALDTAVAGGRTVAVAPRPDFSFPLDGVLAAVSPRTRIVFVTNPNNPTGTAASVDEVRQVARRLPGGALLFVDEAYVDFADGRSFVPHLAECRNVIVGRTFAKAYGLAGLRLGALVGAPEALDPVRPAIGVYSVNVAAVVGLQAALEDPSHVQDYVRQVRESKALVYAACDRLGLQYWRSEANFVLVRVGGGAPAIVAAAARRGIYLRDRSGEPGCAGCIRITAGVVEHTRKGLAVLEEVLCAAG